VQLQELVRKKKKIYKLPGNDFSVRVGNLKLMQNHSNTDNFDDRSKIYERKKELIVCEEKINNFIMDLFYLTELGQKHIYNFLSDLDTEDVVIKNCEIIQYLHLKKFFVLWSSPADSNKILEGKVGNFFVRTSTSLAGQYTFSFNKDGNLLHFRVNHENLRSNLKIYRKQMKEIVVNPIHTHATHYGYKNNN